MKKKIQAKHISILALLVGLFVSLAYFFYAVFIDPSKVRLLDNV
jgi:hypothetical protein